MIAKQNRSFGLLADDDEPETEDAPVAAPLQSKSQERSGRSRGGDAGTSGRDGVAGGGRARDHRREHRSGRADDREEEGDDGVGVLSKREKRKRSWEADREMEDEAEREKR